MPHRRVWDFAWAAWLASTAASFAVLETLALRRRCLPTLTATLRRWLGIEPATSWGRIAPIGFLAAWTWVAVHLTRRVSNADNP